MNKPFLILQLRPRDEVCENELRAIMKYGGLSDSDIMRVRMEEKGIPNLNLQEYAGVIVGGGPSNVSDPLNSKPAYQLRFEHDLDRLLSEVIDMDFPYLGCCYGLGILARHLGSEVIKDKYGEEAGGVEIILRDEGKQDPLLANLPTRFRALVGHKEACQEVPNNATLLASSESCPIQMIKYKQNIYATQFHPEMDAEGLVARILVYENQGYFDPSEKENLLTRVREENIVYPQQILKNFVDRYRTN